jgi:hypothetical protein
VHGIAVDVTKLDDLSRLYAAITERGSRLDSWWSKRRRRPPRRRARAAKIDNLLRHQRKWFLSSEVRRAFLEALILV